MFPFQIRPDRALGEMQEFGLKLSHGLKTLSEIGDIDVGATEKDAVYTEDKVVLYHFRPLVENHRPVPVLIVYALVNRPYMTDLQKNRSMVRGLLAGGLGLVARGLKRRECYRLGRGSPPENFLYSSMISGSRGISRIAV